MKPTRTQKIGPRPSDPPHQHLRYSLREACAYLRVSHQPLHLMIKTGRIRAIREGGRVFIPGAELIRLAQSEAA